MMEHLESVLDRAFPGGRLLHAAALGGGISANATLCRVELASGLSKRVVVRRPGARVYGTGASVAAVESRVLSIVHAAGIPAPKLEYFDEPTNTLVLEHVPGQPDFAPSDVARSMRRMAEALATIHRVTPDSTDLWFLSRRGDSAGSMITKRPANLDASLDEERVRTVLEGLWPWPERNRSVLLHGDYWPGNVVWSDDRISAIIDWEEAELGDPLADVALARLDLWWAFGPDAMDEFTRQYRSLTDIDWDHLPHWDLCIALRPMSNLARWASAYLAPTIARPDIDETSMHVGHRLFVKQAFSRLACTSV